jgi:SAM-dependent methyltransferase
MSDDHQNSDFKLQSYWDSRFKEEEVYDWLVNFDEIKSFILPLLVSTDCKILVVGCGNSTFSSDLYDAGYKNITNIDFSEVCISAMFSKHAEAKPNMEWICMDMTDLKFQDATFDIVIDKASMDALMVDEGDVWDPELETIKSVDKMCSDISRVLKIDGIFLQITFAQPHFRTKYLMANRILHIESNPFESLKGKCDKYDWTLSYEGVNPKQGCITYFIYTMRKQVT